MYRVFVQMDIGSSQMIDLFNSDRKRCGFKKSSSDSTIRKVYNVGTTIEPEAYSGQTPLSVLFTYAIG